MGQVAVPVGLSLLGHCTWDCPHAAVPLGLCPPGLSPCSCLHGDIPWGNATGAVPMAFSPQGYATGAVPMGLCHWGCLHVAVPWGYTNQGCPQGAMAYKSSVNPVSPHPAVTPPPPQPIPSSSIVSTSLVTDLEGLTLTDTSLAPAVSVPSVLPGGLLGPLPPAGPVSPRWSLGPSQLLSPAFGAVRTYELLHRMAGEGLSVEYCFSRRPFPGDPHMVAVQIQISNNTDAEVKSLRVSEPKPLSGMRIQEFPEIGMAQHSHNAAGGDGDGGWLVEGTWDMVAAL